MNTNMLVRRAGAFTGAALLSLGLAPAAKAIPLTWVDGPQAGQAFQGGAIVIKAVNYDTGSLYNGITVGTSIGYSGSPGAGVAAGVTALNADQARGELGPSGANYGPASGEDNWGILNITQILATASDGVLHTIYSPLADPFELTGIFYGEQDYYLNQVTAGSGSAFAGQIIDGTGFGLNIYEDPSKNFSQTAGPNGRTGQSAYTTATDGTLVLSLLSTPGFINANGTNGGSATEFESNTGNTGYAALNVVGGDAATVAQFNTNDIGFGGSFGAGFTPGIAGQTSTDVYLSFTSTQGTNGWDVTSNDPLLADVMTPVPEPSTYGIFGAAALAGVAAIRRRKQKLATV